MNIAQKVFHMRDWGVSAEMMLKVDLNGCGLWGYELHYMAQDSSVADFCGDHDEALCSITI
jgi:hypothetical protein